MSEERDLSGRTFEARLVGGPCNGQTRTVRKDTEVILIGPPGHPFFTYEMAGKEDNIPCFAIRSSSRATRRAVMFYIGRTGTHPAIEFERTKRLPYRKPKS